MDNGNRDSQALKKLYTRVSATASISEEPDRYDNRLTEMWQRIVENQSAIKAGKKGSPYGFLKLATAGKTPDEIMARTDESLKGTALPGGFYQTLQELNGPIRNSLLRLMQDNTGAKRPLDFYTNTQNFTHFLRNPASLTEVEEYLQNPACLPEVGEHLNDLYYNAEEIRAVQTAIAREILRTVGSMTGDFEEALSGQNRIEPETVAAYLASVAVNALRSDLDFQNAFFSRGKRAVQDKNKPQETKPVLAVNTPEYS